MTVYSGTEKNGTKNKRKKVNRRSDIIMPPNMAH
jgi:hypothetical protein